MKPRRRTLRKETSIDTVAMNIRLHEDTHNFLRDQAHAQKRSMNLIVEECVQRYKKMLTLPSDLIP